MSGRLGNVSRIIRFCETSKDKVRIMNRLGLNGVQAESYLTILTKKACLLKTTENILSQRQDTITSFLATDSGKSTSKTIAAIRKAEKIKGYSLLFLTQTCIRLFQRVSQDRSKR